jgi:hypothetical protein
MDILQMLYGRPSDRSLSCDVGFEKEKKNQRSIVPMIDSFGWHSFAREYGFASFWIPPRQPMLARSCSARGASRFSRVALRCVLFVVDSFANTFCLLFIHLDSVASTQLNYVSLVYFEPEAYVDTRILRNCVSIESSLFLQVKMFSLCISSTSPLIQ